MKYVVVVPLDERYANDDDAREAARSLALQAWEHGVSKAGREPDGEQAVKWLDPAKLDGEYLTMTDEDGNSLPPMFGWSIEGETRPKNEPLTDDPGRR